MLRICSWCKKSLNDPGEEKNQVITHGICESCKVILLSSQAPRSITRYLSYFSLPVMMIDGQGRVVAVNQSARDLTGYAQEAVDNEFGGTVMSCQYASRQGGCGKTEHCLACTIRNSVIQTHETGQSLHKVPAHLRTSSPGDREIDLNVLISTEKMADVVLLRIDKVD